jgi:hypothetical protein
VSEHQRDDVPNRELQPEFDAFHYGSPDREDEDGSSVVMEMAGRALTVWREARAVGGSEIHGNRRQSKLHLISPHILFAWSIRMFGWRRMHVAREVLWLAFYICMLKWKLGWAQPNNLLATNVIYLYITVKLVLRYFH